MTIYLALAALLLLLPVVGLIPPIVEGDEERNFIHRIVMRPRTDPKFMAQPYRAVLSQEVVEWYLRWLGAVTLSAGPAWLLRDAPGAVAFQVLVLLLAALWTQVPPLQRQLELIGHATETEVAERMGLSGYAAAEARRIRTAYGALFLSFTVDELAAAIERRRPVARVQVWLLQRRIARATGSGTISSKGTY
jgi:hypothetical protein